MSCDQGSNFVRTFAQLDVIQDDDSADDDERTELERSISELTGEEIVEEEVEEEAIESRARIVTFNSVDSELISIRKIIDSVECENIIEVNSTSFEQPTNLNFVDDSATGQHDFSLNLGSVEIPRFSCACHKLNIVARVAVSNQIYLNDIIRKLSKFGATHRNSIEMNKIFTTYKCRPKLENVTRYCFKTK